MIAKYLKITSSFFSFINLKFFSFKFIYSVYSTMFGVCCTNPVCKELLYLLSLFLSLPLSLSITKQTKEREERKKERNKERKKELFHGKLHGGMLSMEGCIGGTHKPTMVP